MTWSCDYFIIYKWLKAYGVMINCFDEELIDETRLALFPAGTILRDFHHCKSPTSREHDLNLHRTWVQT